MPRELTPLERRWIDVEKSFRRDVAVTTQFLFYQIDAIHSLYRRTRELHATAGSGTVPMPAYPPLRGRLFVAGAPLSEQAAPDGPMEEAAFRSWVVEVYRLWETRYRVAHERAAHPDVPDAIRPEVDPLGDLRRIRNNMLHGGVATRGFKHIKGQAKWDAYTKARFVADWHREAGVGIDRIANALGFPNNDKYHMLINQGQIPYAYSLKVKVPFTNVR